jgi:hypothetical protein
MLTLPAALLPLMGEFAPLFSQPVWKHATVLLVGAIRAPGKRTVPACLRVMGVSQERCFVHYHRAPILMRWVLVRAPQGAYDPQVFLIDAGRPYASANPDWVCAALADGRHLRRSAGASGDGNAETWSALAIARTTPGLLELGSRVTLMADRLSPRQTLPVRLVAWYTQALLSFADVRALVRRCLWNSCHFATSRLSRDVVKVPHSFLERLTDAVCYAA